MIWMMMITPVEIISIDITYRRTLTRYGGDHLVDKVTEVKPQVHDCWPVFVRFTFQVKPAKISTTF